MNRRGAFDLNSREAGTGNPSEDKLVVEKLFEVAKYIVEIKEIIKKMEGGEYE